MNEALAAVSHVETLGDAVGRVASEGLETVCAWGHIAEMAPTLLTIRMPTTMMPRDERMSPSANRSRRRSARAHAIPDSSLARDPEDSVVDQLILGPRPAESA